MYRVLIANEVTEQATIIFFLMRIEVIENNKEFIYFITSIVTSKLPLLGLSVISIKAFLDRSNPFPFTKGPLSLTLTITDFPFITFVTFSKVPKGYVR